MDMLEWKVIITSDKCPYIVPIQHGGALIQSLECDHPENNSRYCANNKCPIKEGK